MAEAVGTGSRTSRSTTLARTARLSPTSPIHSSPAPSAPRVAVIASMSRASVFASRSVATVRPVRSETP